MNRRFVTYLRVSTKRQGRSGLGLEAQRAACAHYIRQNGGELPPLAEFVEVESGKRNDREELKRALDHCRATGAVLVIAKLDRLSRNAAFLMSLRDSGVEFVAADMPQANRFTVGIMALVAEQEREATSTRTREALAAAKARGVKLGGDRGGRTTPEVRAAGVAARHAKAAERARLVAPHIEAARLAGANSLRQIAAFLEDRGIRTATGREHWTPKAVAAACEAARSGEAPLTEEYPDERA